ncbi:hypothetical protein DRP05_11395 [Archaeoglobales archaeon]|nr:MAG: hypothetical protein DRP05_11395 [Archaeoglobales archaeon]
MKELIVRLYEKAREKDWKPWELQDELRKLCSNVVAVGDDLSFVLKFEKDVAIDLNELIKLNGRKTKIYPYKNAVRFDRGYVAFDGKFLRISKDIDEKRLAKILDLIF